MTFKDYLTFKRPFAEKALKIILISASDEFSKEPWSVEIISQLGSIVPSGKLMRFALTQLGYEGYADKPKAAIESLGICMELVQTGLLFHDDIIDEDEKRRGNDALHIAFAKKFAIVSRNPKHYGEGLAICVADFAYFAAFNILSTLDIDVHVKRQILEIVSMEFARVSLAQMQDTAFGQTDIEPNDDDIIAMYRGKTGRYSVALPLVCGAILGGASTGDIELLWKIGESLGILYQIRDDALSIFGDTSKTGKPVGSDIRQNKKTLYRYHLMSHADTALKKKLRTIFGNLDIIDKDLMFVRQSLSDIHTISWIDTYCDGLSKSITSDITSLHMRKNEKEILTDFLSFVTKRNI